MRVLRIDQEHRGSHFHHFFVVGSDEAELKLNSSVQSERLRGKVSEYLDMIS